MFPEYEELFKRNTIYSSIALKLIEKYPHANIISNTRIDNILMRISFLILESINYKISLKSKALVIGNLSLLKLKKLLLILIHQLI